MDFNGNTLASGDVSVKMDDEDVVDDEMEHVETQCDRKNLEMQTNLQPIFMDPDTESKHTYSESNTDWHPVMLEPYANSEDLRNTPEAEKVQEGEPEVNGTRQCPEVQTQFYIYMDRQIWNKIRPLRHSSKLQQPWTHHVYDSFKEQNPCCTLSFKYQHVKLPLSRKKNLPYLQMKTVCTFPSCPAKYSFTMLRKPAEHGTNVKILVEKTGDIQHKLSETKARPATNLKRGEIAKAMMNGPSQYFYSTLQSTLTEQLMSGNMSECLSKKVLKMIRSEYHKRENIHSDILKELHLLQQILKECDTDYFKIPGYIQYFSLDYFSVHLYTERAVSILLHHLQSRSPVSLYLDATRGVVSKIPNQLKRVLYYALVLPGKDKGEPPLPVCEMLSNAHSVPAITHWLMLFQLDLSKYTKINIHHIETDYSWALMPSVLQAFNKENISAYLDRAYEFCMGQKSWHEMKSYTVLHICSAHVLKAVRRSVLKQTEDKGLGDFVTYAFARLQNATNMTEARTVFRALCVLLTSPQNTSLVKESLSLLESLISKAKNDPLEKNMQPKDWEINESEERRNALTIMGRSPFFAYFHQVLQEVKERVASDEATLAKEDNPYYCPGIITILFRTYLAIFPLWSGVLLAELSRNESNEQDVVSTVKLPKSRDTNCYVENWFGIVKHSILRKKKKLKAGSFIRKMHQSLQARYKEHIIQHKLPQKLLLRPQPPMTLDQSQETWRKKEERAPSTKSKFYSVPQTIPAPKKTKNTQEVVAQNDGISSFDTSGLPVKVHCEENEISKLWKKKPSTQLIVAIVRCPSQKLEFLLHHQDFQSLNPHAWLTGELSHYTAGIILSGKEDQLACQGLKKINFEQYDGIITFTNINNNHWRFVLLHAQTDSIFILDLLRGVNEMKAGQDACQKFGAYFNMRRQNYGRQDLVDTKWKPCTIEHSFQEDDSSCGVFVMLMAKQVVEQFPKIPENIDITPSKEMMCEYRMNLARDLLLATVSTGDYCSVCGKKYSGQSQDERFWIQCELCQRRFHLYCLRIILPPAMDL